MAATRSRCFTFTLCCAAFAGCSPSAQSESDEPPRQKTQHLTGTSTSTSSGKISWVPCTPAVLKGMKQPAGAPPLPPGADPLKSPLKLCPKYPVPPPAPTKEHAALAAKQQAYLAAWQSSQAKWQGLTAEEKEAKRALLKKTHLKGGQP